MQLTFLNPFWLLGALALVPLLAHLFSRTRPRRRVFPSVRLLREALRNVTRVRRPRDRWLLLLRTAAMLALALAFLQPWLMSRFGGSGAAKSVVIVVDASASMGYVDGTRTRLASAATAAEDVLASLPTNSKANIVWARAHPAGVLPEPASNLEFLRQALRSAAVLPEGGSPAEALTLALRQLASAEGERELVVISDFQKTAWSAVRWEAPAGVRLTRIAVGAGEAGNTGLADLALEPERPLAGQEAQLTCRVRNFSGEPRRLTVFVQAGESRLSQTVDAGPWSEALAVIPVKFPSEGAVPLKATLAGDSFPADDARYGVAEVRGALDLCIAAAPEDATGRAWLRAARALDHVRVRQIAPAAIASAGRPDLLMLAHWRGEAADAVRALPGAVVIQPAPELDLRALGLPGGAAVLAPSELREAPGWRTRIANEEHPLFALFARGAYGDPADANFRQRLRLPAELGTPVLAFEDGVPALLLASPARAIWNLDLGATDWTGRPAFLAFFGEFVRYLSLRTGGPRTAELTPGDPLRFDPGAALETKDIALLDEQDHAVKLNDGELVTSASPGPGGYRWMAQGAVLQRAVVNFPETESDLRRLTPAEMDQSRGAVLAGAAREQLNRLREGRPIWPWCVGFAALCLLAEALLLVLFHRRSAAADATPAAA